MGKLVFYLLVLLTTLRCTTTRGGAATPAAMNFIKASCKSTLHPTLCIHCLSSYAGAIQASDHDLARAAVTVSLNHAVSAATFVSKLARTTMKPRDQLAVKDCVNSMTNCIANLNRSVQELGHMGQDFEWHMSNIETWVSSALTNENTCVRGFGESSMDVNVKNSATRRMVYVSQITSNSLALVHRFALRHKSGTHMP